MKRDERFEAIKRCQRLAYAGKAAALDSFARLSVGGSLPLPSKGFAIGDMRECSLDIEDTYLIRLFSEFEITLRDFLEKRTGHRKAWKAKHLLDRVASACFIRSDALQKAHSVREFRNFLIHGGPPVASVTLPLARSYLCVFIGYLPPQW